MSEPTSTGYGTYPNITPQPECPEQTASEEGFKAWDARTGFIAELNALCDKNGFHDSVFVIISPVYWTIGSRFPRDPGDEFKAWDARTGFISALNGLCDKAGLSTSAFVMIESDYWASVIHFPRVNDDLIISPGSEKGTPQ
ncbi:MAG: hypothetical protein A2001_01600 [Treponema sp. GWC1_61_84]|nr:MAG: hypothetical protein A2001_01600 [Treponema sp. GWC1_61_84]